MCVIVQNVVLIKMPFGLWTRVGPRKHVLDEVHNGATWYIRLNRLRAAAMRTFVNYFDHLSSFYYQLILRLRRHMIDVVLVVNLMARRL